ncbi:MAG: cytochrome c-type biogenesis CcmF C-terminal domain-containing protein [bacterium]|nr:cytochrome c-type biogenesis CcmF C-terminal domain-containing protein [bacterium]
MPGKILVYVFFFTALLSCASYLLAHLGKDKYIKFGRLFYHLTAVGVLSTAAFLMYSIVTHQFQYAYIWEQSNTELQLPLLMSTFYSGQEGSFLLWTTMTTIIGVFLLKYVSKGERLEAQVMCIFTLIIAFLGFILILKSPFLYVWEKFAGDVEFGYVPPEGRGLNPLLQNFWIVIHPPTLFIGFSSLAVPFCFAIGTLMKNKYNEWIKFSMPWLLFSGMVLGLGIMMGGYWAYGILGWGGYWAWDPVENSSFVPWLVIVAAIHTMIVQKRTGGFKKTNLMLCIAAYLLVLYSSFLTRSGILGDSSVHSFVDPGNEVYLSLIVFISLFTLIALTAIIYRFKQLKALSGETNKMLSRESALFIGAITLCAAALVILAGTSWPIFAKGSIDAEFYNKMNLPIAILIALINGISLLLKWKTNDEKQFFRNLIFPLTLAFVVTIGLVIIGVQDFLIALFALASLFTFFVNAELAISAFRKKKSSIGAYIAHIGIALVFLGIIGSSKYSKEENLSLELNKPVDAFGYRLTYLGATPFQDPNNKTDTKYHFNVRVEKDNKEMLLQPVMYYSEYSKGLLKNPDIANFVTKDFYLSPMGLVEPEIFAEDELHELKKGEEKQIGGVSVKFEDFDFGNIEKGGKEIQSGNYTIGAILNVKDSRYTETLEPKINYTDGTPEYMVAKMTGKDMLGFYFVKMSVKGEDAGGAIATIAVVNKNSTSSAPKADETLVLTASVKPFINVLWAGTVVLVLGFFFSILKRRKELSK